MIEIPKSICINTGCQHAVQSTIDDFLKNVYDHIVEKLNLPDGNGLHPNFKYKLEELHTLNGQPTDGGINYLKYQDTVVAGVIETRTEFNHIQYDFFLNINNLFEE